jgi:hypothetical protein
MAQSHLLPDPDVVQRDYVGYVTKITFLEVSNALKASDLLGWRQYFQIPCHIVGYHACQIC